MVLLLFLSAFFSGSEVAFFSLDPLARKRALTSSLRNDRHILWLLNRPRRLIITLLVGNELVNISTSTVAATLATRYFSGLGELQRTLLSIAIVVPVILIVGEITPKTIAIVASRGWVRRAATPLYLFSSLITPVRFLLGGIANLIMTLLGTKPGLARDEIGEEDFLLLVEKGSEQGKIKDHENDLIKNVFQFGDTLVKEIMTPRERVLALNADMSREELIGAIRNSTFSRIPVFKAGGLELLGLLHVKDLLGRGEQESFEELLRPPFYISQNTKCLRLLHEFQNRRIHMAFVLNERGEVSGIVTLEDLLEELVGEIHDEKEGQGGFV